MKIAVIGTGYVGLTTGASFADFGNEVICVDKDEGKIAKLNKGEMPLYEPGLKELVSRNMELKRLSFVKDISEAIKNVEIVICSVGTPQDIKNRADITEVTNVAKDVGKYMNGDVLFIIKSTVPVGTNEHCKKIISDQLKDRKIDYRIEIASNPEFLKQGTAVNDTINPDRIIVGIENNHTKSIMENLYKPIIDKGAPIEFMDLRSSEIVKYASNAFLCTKISFVNELAGFCEQTGGNIKKITKGMGLDKRIGKKFLNAGIGYGGNCLKKDINALINLGRDFDHHFAILQAVEVINDHQKDILMQKLESKMSLKKGKTVAIWGVTFKPDTDDLRDAPSIDIIKRLVHNRIQVRIYDPEGAETMKKEYFAKEKLVEVAKNSMEAVKGVDALILITEWDEFKNVDFGEIKSLMKGTLVLDGRNIYDPKAVKKAGLSYIGIGI